MADEIHVMPAKHGWEVREAPGEEGPGPGPALRPPRLSDAIRADLG
jgi:hypothetical protein